MKKIFLLAMFVGLFLVGCEVSEEQVPQPKKDNYIEYNVYYKHVKDSTLVISTQSVYINTKLVRTLKDSVMLPPLGTKKITIEDNEGEEKDTTVAIPYAIQFNCKEIK